MHPSLVIKDPEEQREIDEEMRLLGIKMWQLDQKERMEANRYVYIFTFL